MTSDNIVSRLEAKIDAQNSKCNLLIALVCAGLTIPLAVGGWLMATGG